MSADPGLTLTFEPHVGGRIYERTPAGVEHVWGEVLAWEPPRRLAYLWHLRFDRSDATEVEVTFEPDGDSTAAKIVHSGWERLGAWRPTARPAGRARAPLRARSSPSGGRAERLSAAGR